MAMIYLRGGDTYTVDEETAAAVDAAKRAGRHQIECEIIVDDVRRSIVLELSDVTGTTGPASPPKRPTNWGNL